MTFLLAGLHICDFHLDYSLEDSASVYLREDALVCRKTLQLIALIWTLLKQGPQVRDLICSKCSTLKSFLMEYILEKRTRSFALISTTSQFAMALPASPGVPQDRHTRS